MEEKLKELDNKITNIEKDENLEEVEPSTYILEKGKLYKSNGLSVLALKEFELVIEKSKSFNLLMEAVFEIMHLAIGNKDMVLLKKYLDICKKKLTDGGDWEKRNRMKVYEGLYCILNREFKEAGKLFIDALMTFTTYELFDYKTFVFYTSICNIISVDRNTLKTRIIDNSDVVACIKDIPHLEEFLEYYYTGQYALFLSVFLKIIQRLKTDFFISKHVGYFIKEMRVKAYSQYLRNFFIIRIIQISYIR